MKQHYIDIERQTWLQARARSSGIRHFTVLSRQLAGEIVMEQNNIGIERQTWLQARARSSGIRHFTVLSRHFAGGLVMKQRYIGTERQTGLQARTGSCGIGCTDAQDSRRHGGGGRHSCSIASGGGPLWLDSGCSCLSADDLLK